MPLVYQQYLEEILCSALARRHSVNQITTLTDRTYRNTCKNASNLFETFESSFPILARSASNKSMRDLEFGNFRYGDDKSKLHCKLP